MNRWFRTFAILAALITASALPAAAAVNVDRQGTENPVIEIAKSTMYGALGGMVVGLAIELASDDDDSEAVRWGTVIGTFAGLAGGIYFVASRPPADAMLQIEDGRLGLRPLAAFEARPGDGVRVRLAGVKW